MAVATLVVVGVDAVAAVEVEQGVRPVAGLVQPVELGVVICKGCNGGVSLKGPRFG